MGSEGTGGRGEQNVNRTLLRDRDASFAFSLNIWPANWILAHGKFGLCLCVCVCACRAAYTLVLLYASSSTAYV